jgi:hypothetical protein
MDVPALVTGKTVFVFKPGNRQGSVAVYNVSGKEIVKISRGNSMPVPVDFRALKIPDGHYIVRCLSGNRAIVRGIQYVRQ